MADVLDLVVLDAADDATTVLDLNDFDALTLVKDSLQITAPARQQGLSMTDRRYGGGRQTSEVHENGQVACRLLVRGATADEAAGRLSALLAAAERVPGRLWLRWVPDGTTLERRFEIRATAQWAVEYRWAQWAGNHSVVVQVSWQVAPLVHGRRVVMDCGESATPAVFRLPSGVPGDAPALADVTITSGDGTGDPATWALVGWSRAPEPGLAAAPFGLLPAVSAGDVSGWALDGTYLDLRTSSASSASAYSASWLVDPATMLPDQFSSTIAVEAWAYALVDPLLVTPTLTLSARPEDDGMGAPRWTEEWGSQGRVVVSPTGTAWRWTRLGVLRLAVDPLRPRRWRVWLDGAVGAGSAGYWGVRSLVLVPAHQRACSPSGVPADATFPYFVSTNQATEKTVRHDLSAVVGRPGLHGHPDHGLGGQLIELPPGDVQLALILSWLVPDDPRALLPAESLYGVRRARVQVSVTPRWHLLGAP